MSNPNDPAAPITAPGIGDEYSEIHLGMTIRQRFVMAAMQGLCASDAWVAGDDVTQLELERGIAIHAVRIADATLAEEARTRSET